MKNRKTEYGIMAQTLREYRIETPGAISDTRALYLLDLWYRKTQHPVKRALAERRLWHKSFEMADQNGEVAVVWSGRDCDCVSYSGDVHIVQADWRSLEEHIDHTYEWADGPCSYQIMPVAEAMEIEHTSRDLALEAFEDGHPWVIYG